jgi:hypothetical protein
MARMAVTTKHSCEMGTEIEASPSMRDMRSSTLARAVSTPFHGAWRQVRPSILRLLSDHSAYAAAMGRKVRDWTRAKVVGGAPSSTPTL